MNVTLQLWAWLIELFAGLNLTACNNVILVDLWWNPALEVTRDLFPTKLTILISLLGPSVRPGASVRTIPRSIAFTTDSLPSLGQKLPVSIYKLTVHDTVEQRILQVCPDDELSTSHLQTDTSSSMKLQEKKRDLAMAALSGGKLSKGGLKMEELLDLFTRADLE